MPLAFRYPNFRYYLTARMLATMASEMQAVAVGWQIYALTHRVLDLGLVGLAQFLPGILLFLAAGQTAEVWDPQTGEVTPVTSMSAKGGVTVKVALKPYEAELLVVR